MQDPKFFVEQIAALQHQIRALDYSLDALLRQLQDHPAGRPAADTDPRNPKCPICAGDLSDITTMGSSRAQYACTVCEFRGEL